MRRDAPGVRRESASGNRIIDAPSGERVVGMMPQYQRILLKISGEALAGSASSASIPERVTRWRPRSPRWPGPASKSASCWAAAISFGALPPQRTNMDRVTGDHMGMLATVINALAFQDALEGRAFRRA